MKLRKSWFLLLSVAFCLTADEYPKLIAEWDFSKPDVLTAGPFPLKLRKGAAIKDGMLISQSADLKIPGGAAALKVHPGLDMKNAFSAEAVFEVDKASNYKMIFDSKYNYTSGYMGGFMLALRPQRNGRFRPYAAFGYGKESCQVFGNEIALEPGKRHTLRMHFTGIGKVLFRVNGKDAGSGEVKPGGIAKSNRFACIGDRSGSSFNPFGKGIAKFSLYEERPVLFKLFPQTGSQTSFEQGEKDAFLHYSVFNNSGMDQPVIKLVLSCGSRKTEAVLKNLKKGESADGKFALDTALPPGVYPVKAVFYRADGREITTDTLTFSIVKYPKLVAEWDFSKPDVLTAGPIPLKLRKGAAIKDGMLVSQTADRKIPGGAAALRVHSELDMAGAFSTVAVFQVDKASRDKDMILLFDNKNSFAQYAGSKEYFGGFNLALKPRGNNEYHPYATFGFGTASCQVTGNAFVLEPGKNHTLKMFFSGVGNVRFQIDGKDAGSDMVNFGGIAKANRPACIGDRTGSLFNPFGRGIMKFSLYEERPMPFRANLKPGFRTVFERGEKNAFLYYTLYNNSGADQANLKLVLRNGGETATAEIGELKTGKCAEGKIALDTRFLPGSYSVTTSLCLADGREISAGALHYTIVPAYGDFLPRALTGWAKPEKAREFGFTHTRTVLRITEVNGIREKDKISRFKTMDKSLSSGIYQIFFVSLLNSHFAKGKDGGQFLRHNRQGKTYPHNPMEVSNTDLIKKGCSIAEQCAKALGEHPALDLAIINTEVRDSMQPAFGGTEEANFKKFAGFSIPRTVVSKYPAPYRGNPVFPWDRVLPENDKELTYYRWLWKDGDGWNNIHSLASGIVHKYLPHHHTTFFEPAVRTVPCWGSGGRVDALSQWTYTHPDPIKINQALDELRAMADEHDKPILKETQIIWPRFLVAPANKKPDNMPEWPKHEPNARYVTIPPDCLREAIWCNISHRVQSLHFHGSPCIFPDEPRSKSYRYTNPETKYVFKDMAFSVLKPLGPVIKRIPERLPEVAILESFTASIYAPRHMTSGWSHKWTADLHLALQWAQIQPSVIYEDHLLTGKKMEKVKVILLPGCEVLSENVLKKLKELQNRGVILIGDEFLLPALMPDYQIASVKRTADPKESKAKLQKLGREIAAVLKGHYDSPVSATDPDIILRRRGSDLADYLFIANDKRTFGDYLGPWKLVMEKGQPVSGTVTVNHSAQAMYDLVRHTPVAFKKVGSTISFRVDLAPGDGRMLLLLDRKIASLKLDLPTRPLARKDAFSLKCSVLDEKDSAIRAIIPLVIQLTDAKGTELPGSGYYAAENGKLTIKEILAPNMSPGKVTVMVKDLASGLKIQKTFDVR